MASFKNPFGRNAPDPGEVSSLGTSLAIAKGLRDALRQKSLEQVADAIAGPMMIGDTIAEKVGDVLNDEIGDAATLASAVDAKAVGGIVQAMLPAVELALSLGFEPKGAPGQGSGVKAKKPRKPRQRRNPQSAEPPGDPPGESPGVTPVVPPGADYHPTEGGNSSGGASGGAPPSVPEMPPPYAGAGGAPIGVGPDGQPAILTGALILEPPPDGWPVGTPISKQFTCPPGFTLAATPGGQPYCYQSTMDLPAPDETPVLIPPDQPDLPFVPGTVPMMPPGMFPLAGDAQPIKLPVIRPGKHPHPHHPPPMPQDHPPGSVPGEQPKSVPPFQPRYPIDRPPGSTMPMGPPAVPGAGGMPPITLPGGTPGSVPPMGPPGPGGVPPMVPPAPGGVPPYMPPGAVPPGIPPVGGPAPGGVPPIGPPGPSGPPGPLPAPTPGGNPPPGVLPSPVPSQGPYPNPPPQPQPQPYPAPTPAPTAPGIPGQPPGVPGGPVPILAQPGACPAPVVNVSCASCGATGPMPVPFLPPIQVGGGMPGGGAYGVNVTSPVGVYFAAPPAPPATGGAGVSTGGGGMPLVLQGMLGMPQDGGGIPGNVSITAMLEEAIRDRRQPKAPADIAVSVPKGPPAMPLPVECIPALDALKWIAGKSLRDILQSSGLVDSEGHWNWYVTASDQLRKENPLWGGPVYALATIGELLLSASTRLIEIVQTYAPKATPCDTPDTGTAFLVQGLIGLLRRWTGILPEQLTKPWDYYTNWACPITLPSTAEAHSAWLAGTIDNKTWSCWVRANGDAEGPARNVRDSVLQYPDINGYFQLDVRGKVKEEDRAFLKTVCGIHNSTQEGVWRELQNWVPSPSEVVNWMLKDVEDTAIVDRFGLNDEFNRKYQGRVKQAMDWQFIDKADAQKIWAAHWRNMSPHVLYEMHKRLRPGRYADMPDEDALHFARAISSDAQLEEIKDAKQAKVFLSSLTTTGEDLYRALGQSDYPPYWRARLMAISYNVLTRVDIRRAYETGQIGFEQLVVQLQDRGYTPNDAQHLAAFFREAAIQLAARRPAANAWVKVAYDERMLRETLIDNGMRPEFWEEVRKRLRTRRAIEIQTNCLKAIKKRYLLGTIDDDALHASLLLLGTSGTQINERVHEWSCEKKARPKTETAAQVCKYLKQDLIDLPLARRLIHNLGYTYIQAARIIESCMAQGPPKRTGMRPKRAAPPTAGHSNGPVNPAGGS